MGGKRSRKRKHLFFYLACFIVAMASVSGCGKGGITLSQAEKPVSTGNNPVLEGSRKTPLNTKDAFRRSLGHLGEEELYQQGLILAHPLNPGLDHEKSMACFQTLVKKFPRSRLRQASEIWMLTLESVINKDRLIDTLAEKLLSQEEVILNNRKATGRLQTRIKGLKSEIKTSHHQIEELKKQIETLKMIDLGIEKKKRKGTP